MGAGVIVKALTGLVAQLLPLLLTWLGARKSVQADIEQERARTLERQRDAAQDRPSGARDTLDRL